MSGLTTHTPGTPPYALVADIGGTNARFGLMDGAGLHHSRIYPTAAFPSLEAAAAAYLDDCGSTCPVRPRQGAFCVAGPVTGDEVSLTNVTPPWRFSIDGVRHALGLDRLVVLNDFTAAALSVPRLGPDDVFQVGGGDPVRGAAVAVLGPGSGLGVSGLVPGPAGWIPLASEGGHATLPAADERESAVLARIRAEKGSESGHVSAERALSGPGLVNLYTALCQRAGRAPDKDTPAAVTAAAADASDPLCAEAVDMFCSLLGTVAGNLALILGARGGVYIAGGIVPRLGREALARSPFRTRFEAKGRMSAYLAPVPVYVITHPLPAFLGLAEALGLERVAETVGVPDKT